MKKLITALLLLTVITNSFSAETKLEEVMVGKWKNNIDNEKVKGKMRTGKYGELPPLVDSNVFEVSARTDIDFFHIDYDKKIHDNIHVFKYDKEKDYYNDCAEYYKKLDTDMAEKTKGVFEKNYASKYPEYAIDNSKFAIFAIDRRMELEMWMGVREEQISKINTGTDAFGDKRIRDIIINQQSDNVFEKPFTSAYYMNPNNESTSGDIGVNLSNGIEHFYGTGEFLIGTEGNLACMGKYEHKINYKDDEKVRPNGTENRLQFLKWDSFEEALKYRHLNFIHLYDTKPSFLLRKDGTKVSNYVFTNLLSVSTNSKKEPLFRVSVDKQLLFKLRVKREYKQIYPKFVGYKDGIGKEEALEELAKDRTKVIKITEIWKFDETEKYDKVIPCEIKYPIVNYSSYEKEPRNFTIETIMPQEKRYKSVGYQISYRENSKIQLLDNNEPDIIFTINGVTGEVIPENSQLFEKYRNNLYCIDENDLKKEFEEVDYLYKKKVELRKKYGYSKVWVWYDKAIQEKKVTLPEDYRFTFVADYPFWKDIKPIFCVEERSWRTMEGGYGRTHSAEFFAEYRYGFRDREGNEIIPAVLNEVSHFYKGKARGVIIDPETDKRELGWIYDNKKVTWDNGRDMVAERIAFVNNPYLTPYQKVITDAEKNKKWRKDFIEKAKFRGKSYFWKKNPNEGDIILLKEQKNIVIKPDKWGNDALYYRTGIYENGKEKLIEANMKNDKWNYQLPYLKGYMKYEQEKLIEEKKGKK